MKKLSYHNLFEIILLAVGIFGLLGGFYNALVFPEYNYYMVIFWLFMGTVLYVQEVLDKRWKYLTALVISSISIIIVCLSLEFITLIEGIKEVIANDYFLNFTELFTNYHISSLLVITIYMAFGYLVTKILVYYICHQKHQKKVLISCILWMIFPYFIDHPMTNIYFYTSIFFIISSYFYKSSLQSLQKKAIPLQITISIVLVAALCLFEFKIANNAVFQKEVIEIFDGLAYLKQRNGSGNSELGASIKPETNLPTGDITINTDEALTVISNRAFSGYLRGFSLATYKDNKWDTPKKGTQYPSINYYADAVSKGETFKVSIETRQKHTYQYVPYYSNVGRNMNLDSYVNYSDTYHTVILDNEAIDKVVSVDEEYQYFVQDNYMDVDIDTKAMLETYLVNKGINIEELRDATVETKIDTIRNLLSTNTKYSLSAGELPEGVDFIDNFLNISKYGSCTHYASSAALLLRLLDIPTRFTSGFVISKGDFENGQAIIRNNRSHAWVEVFDEQYGWYPVEFTPSYDEGQEMVSQDPGQLSQRLDNQIPGAIPNTPDTPATGDTPTTTPLQTNQDTLTPILPYLAIGAGGIAIIVLWIMQRKIRYQRKVKRYLSLTNNQKVCRGYQYLIKNTIATSAIEEISLKAKFSQYAINQEEVSFFEEYVKQQLDIHYKELPFYKKIYYTYIQAKR